MNIELKKNEGLSREYSVVVPAADVDAKVDEELGAIKGQINMPGFRPGKAPISLLKKTHGKAIRGRVLENLITSTLENLYKDEDIKPAMQPKLDVQSFEEDGDLEFSFELEILPEITAPDFSKLKLERMVVEVADKTVDEEVANLAKGQKSFKKAAKTHKAKNGDAVLMDFVGKVDGVEFDGGKGEGHQLELGSNTFIPGFEEQLVGAKAGDEVTVKVTFPAEYHSADLAGKDAEFDCTVHEVRKPEDTKVDDDFAKNMGLESLDSLKEAIKGQLAQQHEGLSAAVLKRGLLDALAAEVDFPVPAGMVDLEFRQIWEQIKMDAIRSGEAKPEDFEGKEGPEDDAEAAEYKSIAERRVRLGLLLSEVGQQRDVQITQEEVNRRLMQEASRYPGQEQQVFEYYKNNENALASLRAPIYEEKVCELILSEAKVTEKKATLEELEAAFNAAEEDEVEETKKKSSKKKAPAKKAAAKKAPAKKAAAKKDDAKKAPAKKAAAKKPAAKKPAAKKAPAKKKAADK